MTARLARIAGWTLVLSLGLWSDWAAAQTAPPDRTPPPTAASQAPGKAAPALPTEELTDEPEPEEPPGGPRRKALPSARPRPPAVNAPVPGVLGEAPATDGVLLQALDKVTARVTRLRVGLGETVSFGTLEITPRACAMRPPEETPESSAFLEIVDKRGPPAAKPLFSGWMFASSPSLSALEHPFYDVWVTSCRTVSAPDRPPVSPKK